MISWQIERMRVTLMASYGLAAFAALLRDYAPVENARHDYWTKGAICSMLINEVEDIWQAISEKDDWHPLQRKICDIREMGQAHISPES